MSRRQIKRSARVGLPSRGAKTDAIRRAAPVEPERSRGARTSSAYAPEAGPSGDGSSATPPVTDRPTEPPR